MELEREAVFVLNCDPKRKEVGAKEGFSVCFSCMHDLEVCGVELWQDQPFEAQTTTNESTSIKDQGSNSMFY